MDLHPLPLRSPLAKYQRQAVELLHAHSEGDSEAIKVFHENHPRFLDAVIPWLPKPLSDSEIHSTALNLPDAQLALARWYSFLDWSALETYVEQVSQDGPVQRFETAVDAVVNGNLPALQSLLRKHPDLIQARSTRINNFDPPVHRATLLHYVGANGVEGYRQKTPPNAVEIAKALLTAGAEVDALAEMYGGKYTTMSMLVSSCHPANARVQVALVDTLVDFGASVNPSGSEKWGSPLKTALAFGYHDAAEALVRRGAAVDNVATAAALGRLAQTAELLPTADAESRHRALALAAQHGHAEIVGLLLDAGEDPNRYNPEGNHAHSTPMHQAALAGHASVVKLLVERGARLDIEDTIYHSTPLGRAIHGGQDGIARLLREQRPMKP